MGTREDSLILTIGISLEFDSEKESDFSVHQSESCVTSHSAVFFFSADDSQTNLFPSSLTLCV